MDSELRYLLLLCVLCIVADSYGIDTKTILKASVVTTLSKIAASYASSTFGDSSGDSVSFYKPLLDHAAFMTSKDVLSGFMNIPNPLLNGL